MAEKKQDTNAVHRVVKSTVQKLIEQEAYGWPPYTIFGMYQPERPEAKNSESDND